MSSVALEQAYHSRLKRVLEHIDAHLAGDLSLETLSGVASFSKFHFSRQFAELFGVGVHEYVKLTRLRRAAHLLAFRAQHRVIDIALESGYDSPEAFARAFKKVFERTPSEFREQPDWELWHRSNQPLTRLRTLHMAPQHRSEDVTITDFPATRVAALEHRGDPRRLGESIRKFIEWRRANGLPPRVSATFNLLYEDPASVAPEEFRLDLCAATSGEIGENAQGVVERMIPGGRCAVLRHTGSDDTLAESIRHLYVSWLPASGEEPRDFPLFVRRVRFYPDVAEHEAVSDLFLPLK